jgi:Tol biopolymer transport system component
LKGKLSGVGSPRNMKNPAFPVVLAFLAYTTIKCASPDAKYGSAVTPGTTPEVFAPGRVSTTDQFEFGAVFSKDLNEFYYAVEINGRAETRMMTFENGTWSSPTTILQHEIYSFNDPFLSPDEKKLFFISDRPLNGDGPKKDYDIWYIERNSEKWSQPINAGQNINSERNEYYISFTNDSKMYFSSNVAADGGTNNYDIYSSLFRSGAFDTATKLDSGVNSPHYEADVFVAPDESYLVFATNRPGGLGSGDLHVSFRDPNGNWTKSRSLGNTINTETDDFCPYVTADGKYLFYASRGDVYWVSTEVIEKLR